MLKFPLALVLFLASSYWMHAQEQRVEGKIIKDYGATFEVNDLDLEIPKASELKVIFDVSSTSEDKSQINKYIETAARFLNMHADAGMSKDQLQVAMTIHASAWKDILTDDAYKQRFGVANPNSGLIAALEDEGVDIILCGQTKAFRKIEDKEVLEEVKIALSAMTALLDYQNNGYKFIKF